MSESPVATAGKGLPWHSERRRCEWQDCGRLYSPGRPTQRFCDIACKNAWHDLHRPRLASAAVGHPRKSDLLTLWIALMSDGQYRDCMQMAVALKCLPQSASATLRRARAKGFRVESDLPNGSVKRPHRYRLLLRG